MSHAIGARLQGVGLTLNGKAILKNINLEFPASSNTALLGVNGAGKSQLLKILVGERWPDPDDRGQMIYVDARAKVLEKRDILARIALVSGERQDKYLRYDWNFSVQRVVGTGCHGDDRPIVNLSAIERRRVTKLLQRWDLWHLRRRRFLTLSYGERRRVLLARALAVRPKLLLLDEPFNGLDDASRHTLDRELRHLAKARITVIVTGHRAEDIPRAFTRIVVLKSGRVQHDGLRCALVTRSLQESPEKPRLATVAMVKSHKRRRMPLVTLRNASLYRDYRPVLRGVNWVIGPQENWAIVGANGSGKSSLLRCLYGDLPIALGGVLERRGHAPGVHIEEWRRRIGLVSPELQAEYLDDVTLLELVVSGIRASIGLDFPATAAERSLAAQALQTVGLICDYGRPVARFSYGQRRLALFARAIVRHPEALLLDEPLTGLDTVWRVHVRTLLSHLAQGGMQLVMATHHRTDLIPEITHVMGLKNGSATVGRRADTGYFSPLM